MAPEAIALLASVSFALFAVYGWLGLLYSTPLVGTIVSLSARTITLGAAVALSGGIPEYQNTALTVFVGLGLLQSGISLLTFIGLQKIGTSRSQPLRNSYPLWSALIAVVVMHERASLAVLVGTLLVVVGVVLIFWKPESTLPNYRAWHVMYSLGAGFLAGLAFPLRRYGLTISNEPIFFSFVVAVVSLLGAVPYLFWKRANQRLVWQPKGVLHFLISGFCEALGALLTLVALTNARVVIVSPIVATTPFFSLVISLVFLRGKERVTGLTILGTVAVVAGTVAIALGK
ncbi:MAG: EamA family transporter [Chloroflexota bacterium]